MFASPPQDPNQSAPPPDHRDDEIARIAGALSRLTAKHADLIQPLIPLRDLTTLRIGGPALGLCRILTIEQARRFREEARALAIPTLCLGGGSNVLADDRGFAGLVLRMEITEFIRTDDVVEVGAGLSFDDLIARSLGEGLVGLEFASGIPGSVGGAVIGNAGCFGHEIGEFVEEALVLRADGCVETVGREAFRFAYRRSAFQGGGDIVLSLRLRLRRGDVAAATRQRASHMQLRRERHPVTEPCAGSWFKNLEPDVPGGRRRAAGELLDQAGAKSLRVGGAAVYPKHANIIVNLGSATSADVRELAAQMHAAVIRKFGVNLEPEVRALSWLDAPARPNGAR